MLTLRSNQVATGLALTLFGLGLSSLIGQGYVGIKPPLTAEVPLGPLADIPVIGQVLFQHDWVVFFSIAVVAAGLLVARKRKVEAAGRVVLQN